MARKGRSPSVRQSQQHVARKPHAVRIPASAFPTDLERIECAVRFVQMDLDALRASDWVSLRENLERMRWPSRSASGGGKRSARSELMVPHQPWEDLERELPERAVRKLQRETEQLLLDVVHGQDVLQHRKPFAPPTRHRLVFYCFPLVFSGRIVRQIEGKFRDQFIHLLFTALEQEPPNRVRRCPECPKLFVRRRKQAYCSERCNNRVTARKWRAKPAVKKKRRKDAREKYAEDMREKSGGTVSARSRS